MTETAAATPSREPSALEPLATNTQPATDRPAQTPDSELSEPGPAEHSEVSEETVSSAARQAMEDDQEVQDIKSTMLDSAGLANQAANHALKAGDDLQKATQNLIKLYDTQRKLGVIVLVSCGTLLVTAMVLFVLMSSSLKQRITQADAMLVAVGKRIVTMNESIEIINATGDILRTIASNQSALSDQQVKLDGRLDEALKAAQNVAATTTKDPKTPDIGKLLQAMEAQIQGNASALKSLAAQQRSKPVADPDSAAIRREVEASLLRQQRKNQTQASTPTPAPTLTQNQSATPTPAPAVNPAPAKPVERLVQYPRVQSAPTTAP
jgi:hypothetical protein